MDRDPARALWALHAVRRDVGFCDSTTCKQTRLRLDPKPCLTENENFGRDRKRRKEHVSTLPLRHWLFREDRHKQMVTWNPWPADTPVTPRSRDETIVPMS
jgi:hypothetical protein